MRDVTPRTQSSDSGGKDDVALEERADLLLAIFLHLCSADMSSKHLTGIVLLTMLS